MKASLDIELRKIDVIKSDFDSGDLSLSFDYIFEGKSFGSFSRITINRPDLMIAEFTQNLLEAPQVQTNPEEEITIQDRDKVKLKLRDFFKRFVVSRARHIEGVLTDEDRANLTTSGLDLKDLSQSLDQKSVVEKIDILLQRARQMVAGKHYFLALETIQKVIKLDVNSRMAFFYKGQCHQGLGELEEACGSYKKWKELSGVHIREPYIYLAKVLIALNKFHKALELYDEYIENFPNEKTGLLWKAQIYFKLRQKRFMRLLDRVYIENEEAVRTFLKTDWDYSQATKDKPSWLTPKLARAFLNMSKEEFAEFVKERYLPSHFDDDECKYIFNKDELRNWTEITTRYKVFDRTYQSSPELLREAIQAIRWERKRKEKKLKRRFLHKKYLPSTSQTTFLFN